MRHTTLHVALPFPCALPRQPVRARAERIVTPVEKAVDDVESRCATLRAELRRDGRRHGAGMDEGVTVDVKTLSQALSGCVLLQVNGGAKEVGEVYLTPQEPAAAAAAAVAAAAAADGAPAASAPASASSPGFARIRRFSVSAASAAMLYPPLLARGALTSTLAAATGELDHAAPGVLHGPAAAAACRGALRRKLREFLLLCGEAIDLHRSVARFEHRRESLGVGTGMQGAAAGTAAATAAPRPRRGTNSKKETAAAVAREMEAAAAEAEALKAEEEAVNNGAWQRAVDSHFAQLVRQLHSLVQVREKGDGAGADEAEMQARLDRLLHHANAADPGEL